MPPRSGLPALSVQYSREQAAQVSAENQFFRRIRSNHFNRGRPHSALDPGIPERPQATVPASGHRHRLPNG